MVRFVALTFYKGELNLPQPVLIAYPRITYIVREHEIGRTLIDLGGSHVYVDETPEQILDILNATEIPHE